MLRFSALRSCMLRFGALKSQHFAPDQPGELQTGPNLYAQNNLNPIREPP